MTRINSAIPVIKLTDEHLLAEHREIKRLPANFVKSLESGALKRIPEEFCLGKGHVIFFLDKARFTLDRYRLIREECLRRGLNVPDYSENWKLVSLKSCWKSHIPTEKEKALLIQRISEKIKGSPKACFHYERRPVTKEEAAKILTD